MREHWGPLKAQYLPVQKVQPDVIRHDGRGKKVIQVTEPSPSYPGRGDAGLLSGVRGNAGNHRDGWQGFHGTDFSILIDLGKTLRIDSIVIGTLTNIALGIMPPLEVQVSAGSAPDSLRPFGTLESIEKASAQTASPVRNQHRIRARGVSARYVHVDVRCTKILPSWHPAAGQKAWLFIDNILVNPSGTR
jgi:hexosaminidase